MNNFSFISTKTIVFKYLIVYTIRLIAVSIYPGDIARNRHIHVLNLNHRLKEGPTRAYVQLHHIEGGVPQPILAVLTGALAYVHPADRLKHKRGAYFAHTCGESIDFVDNFCDDSRLMEGPVV